MSINEKHKDAYKDDLKEKFREVYQIVEPDNSIYRLLFAPGIDYLDWVRARNRKRGLDDMITNEERKNIACKMRKIHLEGANKDLIELILSDTIGAWHKNGMSWDYIIERLADLIDPEPELRCEWVWWEDWVLIEVQWANWYPNCGCWDGSEEEFSDFDDPQSKPCDYWNYCPICGKRIV